MEIKTTIIGAGVVGLAIASKLSENNSDIIVIEKEDRFGQGTSSRNSEVIHAGIYYPANSLKAKLCVRGNKLLYEFCIKHKIKHKNCGKIIIANSEEEDSSLNDILNKASSNGVTDLYRISNIELKKMEPEVKAYSCIYSPSTGIIDSHNYMRCLFAKAKNKGVDFLFGTRVENIEFINDKYKVYIRYPDGKTENFLTNHIINCAGLESDIIARSVGIDIDQNKYRLHFWKGEYFSLPDRLNLVNHLVYPVPHPNNVGLGIHATIDINGRLKLGPNAEYLPKRNYDYSVNEEHQKQFFEAANRYLSSLKFSDLSPEMAGIRPKLQKPGDKVRDFIIQEETEKGFPGLINLIGIESPGLTSSLAISEHVAHLLRDS